MTKTFTENDLIRYAYGETTKRENQEIENAMLCDQALQDSYLSLKQLMGQLDECMLSPSDERVNKILNYAKSSKLPSVVK